MKSTNNSEFKLILEQIEYHDKLYLFLQNIFNVLPADQFFDLIVQATKKFGNDYEIYTNIQQNLPKIKPFLADLTYALPALFKQKNVIIRQTKQLVHLYDLSPIDGYLEIGTVGRYVSGLTKQLNIKGALWIANDKQPTYGPIDILDRGGIAIKTKFILLDNYVPLAVPDDSLDMLSCFVGLHHIPLISLEAFINSIAKGLRSGGKFILRDHDCRTENMTTFVSLIHSVFNLGSNISVQDNYQEIRLFRSVNQWVEILAKSNLYHHGEMLYQEHDPSKNALMMFIKK